MRGTCPECGHKNPVPASGCLWCMDVGLLSGGFVPDRIQDRWSEEDYRRLQNEAAARRRRLMAEADLRKEARRRARTEVQRVEDGQEVFV